MLVTFFIIPVNRHVRRRQQRVGTGTLTRFPFGERYMTSGFVLDEFNLDLPASRLLVRLGLFPIVVVVVYPAVHCVVVVDEPVLTHDRRSARGYMSIHRRYM